MTATAGFKGRVRITSPTGVAMVDEPMGNGGSGLIYHTTDATKNLWDPRVEPVVEDGGGVVASGYVIDYLLGKVTFAAPPTGSVIVTASYLPRYTLPACKSYSLAMTTNLLDKTVLGDEAVAREPGLKDASGTLERLESGLEDYDTSGATVRLWDLLDDGTPVGLEFRTNEASAACTRCYALIQANNLGGGVADLATASVTFNATTWANSATAITEGDPTT
jgi:hypothetical protein